MEPPHNDLYIFYPIPYFREHIMSKSGVRLKEHHSCIEMAPNCVPTPEHHPTFCDIEAALQSAEVLS